MKTKNIVLVFFSLLTFAAHSQNEKDTIVEPIAAFTELKVKTNNLDELKNFDWNTVREIFHENEKDQDITLAFAYINKSEVDKSKIRVDNFDFKFKGKTSELENLVNMSKKMIDKLINIEH
jgi:hypothetical protein